MKLRIPNFHFLKLINIGSPSQTTFKNFYSWKKLCNKQDGQWTNEILSECMYQPKRCCICKFLELNRAVHSPRSDSQDLVLILLGLIPQRPAQRLVGAVD